MEAVDSVRKPPLQRRARDKMGVIIEAAAQLLERDGEAGFNTNRIAERAGVSIGTLYRYFPNKQAILVAMARNEIEAHRRVAALPDQPGLAPDRAMIRAFLHAFGGRTRARRVAMTAWFAGQAPGEMAGRDGAGEGALLDVEGKPLSPIATFVLSRALLGAMRAAVLEGADFLKTPEFENELVQLGRVFRGFMGEPSRRSPAASHEGVHEGSPLA